MTGSPPPFSNRVALLQWIARIGPVSADAIAALEGAAPAAARARLGRLAHERMLVRWQVLAGEPSLYTVTRAGLREADLPELEPSRVSAAGAAHALVCARVAAVLQHAYPDALMIGDRELRRRERACGELLASVPIVNGSVALAEAGARSGPDAGAGLHRPDLVLRPSTNERRRVAVEIELTVKAPRRLVAICRAWGRSRDVAGVIYIAPLRVRRALARAIAPGDDRRIVVLELERVMPVLDRALDAASARIVPSAPYVGDRGSTIEQTERT
jgi:hypothetical protein